jgi:hypothetical protein
MTTSTHNWRDRLYKWLLIFAPEEFLAFFMTDLFNDYDTSEKIIAINGLELPIEGAGTDKGMRISDVLMIIPMKGGQNNKIACLIELQHENAEDFGRRMYDLSIRQSTQGQFDMVTACAFFTGGSKNVYFHSETRYGLKITVEFRSFHIQNYEVETLRQDKTPFGRVLYAGLSSFLSGDNLELREKYAWELLDMADDMEYTSKQRRLILEFSRGIFRLNDSKISKKQKEAYNMKMIPLVDQRDEMLRQLVKEEGIEEATFKFVRNLLSMGFPVETIKKATGLNEATILSLKKDMRVE